MKKIISIILILTFALSAVPAFAEITNEHDMAALLYELNIMQGDGDGNLRLDDPVTRAEFCKIAIASSEFRNSVATNLTISPFRDVNYDFWAAPYIKLAVSNKYVLGYPDGYFRPENNVLYEEALTICLKILGYTDEDFGASWPYGQVGLATNIELAKDVNRSVGDSLTRRDVMRIVFNMMGLTKKASTSVYITSMGYAVAEDVVLIATAKQDASVGANKLYTTAITATIDADFDQEYVGRKGDLIFKGTDEFVSFIPSEQTIDTYNIYQIMGEKIAVQNNGAIENLDIDTSVTVYNKSQKTTLKDIMAKMAAGDSLTVYTNENGMIDYCIASLDATIGPVTVQGESWAAQIGADTSDLTVIRDGQKSSASAISVNDIIYYSKTLNTVWAYTKRETGVYEKAEPNKDMPTSVTISGKVYEIEGTDAFNHLSSNGRFNIGDTVVLLLGRTGKIADVIAPADNKNTTVGYLIETGKKNRTNVDGEEYSAFYVKVVLPTGEEQEYTASKDCSSYKNKIVQLSFEQNAAVISSVKANSAISGTFSANRYTLGDTPLATTVDILDVTTTMSDEVAGYKAVFPQRLDAMQIKSGDVLHCEKNVSGEITSLILKDVTGDAYKYGMLTKVDTTKDSGIGYKVNATFMCDIGGTSIAIKANSSAQTGQAVRVIQGKDESENKVESINNAGKISAVSGEYLTAGGNKYNISPDVVIYSKNKMNEYFMEPGMQSITHDNMNNAVAFVDKTAGNGGRVRVIVIQP